MIAYRDLLGVPFIDGGRNPATGLDCWGLFMEVMRRFGNDVPDFQVSCFDTASIDRAFREEAWGSGAWDLVENPAAGVSVVMMLNPYLDGMVQHYGVCLDEKRFIHTLHKTGVIVSRLDHRFFARKIAGYYAWNSSR